MTREEVAVYTRRSVRSVDRAIASGQLRSTKPGGKRLSRLSWVEAWLNGAALALASSVFVWALMALAATLVICSCGFYGVDEHHSTIVPSFLRHVCER